MNRKHVFSCLALSVLLGSSMVVAAEDSDTDRSSPTVFVKDSAITTKIKTKLAAEHPTSLARIHVDTDKDGVVVLSGTATSQEAIDRAVAIASETEHVKSVVNHIKIRMGE